MQYVSFATSWKASQAGAIAGCLRQLVAELDPPASPVAGCLAAYLLSICEAQLQCLDFGHLISEEHDVHHLVDWCLKKRKQAFHSSFPGDKKKTFRSGVHAIASDKSSCTVIEVWRDEKLACLQFADHILPERRCSHGAIRAPDVLIGELKYMWWAGCGARSVVRPTHSTFESFDPVQFHGYVSYMDAGHASSIVYCVADADLELQWRQTRLMIRVSTEHAAMIQSWMARWATAVSSPFHWFQEDSETVM